MFSIFCCRICMKSGRYDHWIVTENKSARKLESFCSYKNALSYVKMLLIEQQLIEIERNAR